MQDVQKGESDRRAAEETAEAEAAQKKTKLAARKQEEAAA